MKKRICLGILIVFVLTVTFSFLTACNKGGEQQQQLSIVYLGDSIGEGLVGALPIVERENNAYYGIIGIRNNYKFINRAVSGHQTKDMLEYIKRDDEGADITKTHIKDADIIHVSILGNDFLLNDVSSLMQGVLIDNDIAAIDAILENSIENFAQIVETLRTANSTALLYFQNVYNPIFEDSPLIRQETREVFAEHNVSPEDFRQISNTLLDRLNNVISDYLTKHPNSFRIIDTQKAFNDIYNQDEKRGKSLIAADGVHPSTEGHAVIADLIQSDLETLGMADAKNAVDSYKNMRKSQIQRLFKDSIDVTEANKTIDNVSTCKDVTKAYFKAINGKTPVLQSNSITMGNGFSQTKQFRMGQDTQFEVMGMDVSQFITGSAIFRDDGTVSITIELTELALAAVLVGLAGVDIDMNIRDFINNNVSDLLPGFSANDIESSLQMIKEWLGISIVGLNFNEPSVKEFVNTIETDGRLPKMLLNISRLGIRYNGSYYVENITSQYSGNYTAIYLYNHSYVGEPYIKLTLKEEDGVTSVRLSLEVAKLRATAILVNN